MNQVTSVELKRDCPATQIPSGQVLTLPAGTPVDITQSLGGTYTVHSRGGLFRIASRDADALGLQADTSSLTAVATAEGPVDEAAIWKALKTCYDPEIPVNIVDLGLVYDLSLHPLPSGQSRVSVKMTLTAPGCGMGATIAGDAQQKILCLAGVEEADVEVVWDPPWDRSKMTEAAKLHLGMM